MTRTGICADTEQQTLLNWLRCYRETGNKQAWNKLCLYCIKFVRTTMGMLGRFSRGDNRLDLRSHAIIEMISALNTYDEGRGATIKTYVIMRIRNGILDYNRQCIDHIMRMPRTMIEWDARRCKARTEFIGKHNREPTTTELCRLLRMNETEYTKRSKAFNIIADTCNYRGHIITGHDETGGEFAVDLQPDPVNSINCTIDRIVQTEFLDKVMHCLPQRERMVVSLYYGEDKCTFKEIGRRMNISESRAYQLHSQALIRMRRDAEVLNERGIDFASVLGD